MNEKEKNIIWILVAILLLLLITRLQQPTTFSVFYQGQEYKGYETNVTGWCWTLGKDTCVKQQVKLLNLTAQSLLICPEGYYGTKVECEKENQIGAFKPVIKQITCYYIKDNKCVTEVLEGETCPSAYYATFPLCEEALQQQSFIIRAKAHLSGLFKKTSFIWFIVISVLGLIVIIFTRKR